MISRIVDWSFEEKMSFTLEKYLLIFNLKWCHFKGRIGVKILFHKVEDKWSLSHVLGLCHIALKNHVLSYLRLYACTICLFSPCSNFFLLWLQKSESLMGSHFIIIFFLFFFLPIFHPLIKGCNLWSHLLDSPPHQSLT